MQQMVVVVQVVVLEGPHTIPGPFPEQQYGAPEEHLDEGEVRIFYPSKSSVWRDSRI